jgi:curved DNA-binding protein CbpA
VVDHYAILGVAPDCEPEQIKAAYRALVLIHHPDQNPAQTAEAHERFLEIKAAYELLSDPEERADYDIACVAAFPERYAFEDADEDEEEEEWEPNPPARMPVVRDGDGSTTLLRMLLVFILPIVAGVIAMVTTDSGTIMILATLGALVLAIWLGSLMRPDAE